MGLLYWSDNASVTVVLELLTALWEYLNLLHNLQILLLLKAYCHLRCQHISLFLYTYTYFAQNYAGIIASSLATEASE